MDVSQLREKTMKTLIVTSLLALSASTAMAADAVYETPAPPVAQETLPVFTWSGPYLGIQGGAGWANGDFSAGGPVVSDDFNGGILGAFAGYNYQFDNNMVLGIEGDVDYNWNDNDYSGIKVGTDWQGSVRGRVGYAFDHALIYATMRLDGHPRFHRNARWRRQSYLQRLHGWRRCGLCLYRQRLRQAGISL